MKLVFFIKDDCTACQKAKDKVAFFLDRWGETGNVTTEFHNVSTAEGLVEAAMREVGEIPTVLLESDGAELQRWTKRPPTSAELKVSLGIESA